MLKVAMLGMGGISGSHRNAWKQFEDAKVIACCDIRPEKADAAAEDLGCKAYYCYEDIYTMRIRMSTPYFSTLRFVGNMRILAERFL